MRRQQSQPDCEYNEKTVTRMVDDNPVFNTSLRMQSPAPDGHFLRVFGQPNRDRPGRSARRRRVDAAGPDDAQRPDHARSRPASATWSRCTSCSPARRPISTEAVKLAYREILTREPTADELTEGQADRRKPPRARSTAWPTCAGCCSTATSSDSCRKRTYFQHCNQHHLTSTKEFASCRCLAIDYQS